MKRDEAISRLQQHEADLKRLFVHVRLDRARRGRPIKICQANAVRMVDEDGQYCFAVAL
jgi:hypothetical protein